MPRRRKSADNKAAHRKLYNKMRRARAGQKELKNAGTSVPNAQNTEATACDESWSHKFSQQPATTSTIHGMPMADGGITIYPGYTGVLCLYHRITKHVIVQWTGVDGVDQQSKSNAEQALLSLFQATAGAKSPQKVTERRSEHYTAESQTVLEEGTFLNDSRQSHKEIMKPRIEDTAVESQSLLEEGAALDVDIHSMQTVIKDEPRDYKPTDVEVNAIPLRSTDNAAHLELVDSCISVTVDLMETAKGRCSSDLIVYAIYTGRCSSDLIVYSIYTDVEVIQCNTIEIYRDCCSFGTSRTMCMLTADVMETAKDVEVNVTTLRSTENAAPLELVEPCVSVTADVMEAAKDTNESHQCTVCGKHLPTEALLRKHIVTHQKRIHRCRLCERQFSSQKELKAHLWVRKGREVHRPQRCGICGQIFHRNSHLMYHYATHGAPLNDAYWGQPPSV